LTSEAEHQCGISRAVVSLAIGWVQLIYGVISARC
jgi:hypothetical protein